jgi:competence ComEA-like helix-hairpin-helix protein
MAKIPLRTYNNEIETIIEQQQTEEAISHCRHILKIYPKHIDTYRLLGKAYLESRRLGNAADIFERVLSAIPYDFVSHVGLSITSEDIGDLDKAIWHMERAFEGQPYNAAIQGELRRLYGRRDGMEPPKIHLTRAALARMYAKGDLFQQAIAELRAAISEDPNRFDLRIFLAKMYVQIGETTKAIESCGAILKKLPYCFDANQLLVQLLSESGRTDESGVYIKRLQELDPYQAHINLNAPDKGHVQDQAVLVEQLIWDGGSAVITTDQPDWATSVGVTIENSEADEDNFQDWLANSSETNDFFSNNVEDVSDDQNDDLIPDFMKDAGWGPSTGSFDESKSVVDVYGDQDKIDEKAIEGELPDWLQNLAPSDENNIGEGDLINSNDPYEMFEVGETDQEMNIFDDEQAPQNIPDWLSELDDGTESKEHGDDLPDWLVEKDKTISDVSEDRDESEVPDWLIPTAIGTASFVGTVDAADNTENEDQKEEATEQSGEGEDFITQDVVLDESIAEIESQTIPMITDVAEQEIISSTADSENPDLPEWLDELDLEKDATQTEASQLPEWLQDIEEKPESPIPIGESLPDQIPEWLADIIDDESQLEEVEEAMEEVFQAEWIQETIIEQEAPEPKTLDDDLSDEYEPTLEEEIPDSTVEIFSDQENPNEFELIRSDDIDFVDSQEIAEKEFDQADEEVIAIEESDIPGWIQEDVETEEDLMEVIEQAPHLETEEEFTQSDKSDDQDSALVWLEAIALAEDVLDEEALDKPSDTSLDNIQDSYVDAIPEDDLNKEEIPVEDSVVDQPITLEEIGVGKDTAIVSGDEYILETDEKAELIEGSGDSSIEGVDEKEDLIKFENDTDETLVGEVSPTDSTSIEIEDSEIIFTWLDEIEPQQEKSDEENQISSEIESDEFLSEIPVESIGLPERSDDLTSLGQVDDEDGRPTAQEVNDEPDFDDVDAALAWLEGLAAKQGVSEDELITRPDDRSETPPEWAIEDTQSELLVDSDLDTYSIEKEESSDLLSESYQNYDDIDSNEFEMEIESGEKLDDVDAAMAWLESLAAKQGVSEDELLTTPSERSETPPEWMSKSEDIGTESIAVDDQEQADISAISQDDETPYAPPAWVTDGQVPEDEDLSGLPTEEIEVEDQLLDLNQASLIQLERLPGVGFRKAQSITAYREQHGEFRSLESLMNVPGMDHETLELLKAKVTIKITEEKNFEGNASQQVDLYDQFNAEPDDENHEKQLAAQAKLNSGSIKEAMDDYQKLIQNGQRQNAVIDDLVIAAEKYPEEVSIWQTLGDAYMNMNRLQDAIEAYTKAQSLLD